MIRQESKYYPDTFQMKEFKEFNNDVLIIHIKYDKEKEIIFESNSFGKGKYKNGTQHGEWIEFSSAENDIENKSFNVIQKGKYIKGKRHGLWNSFYETGEPYWSNVKMFHGDVLDQELLFYYITGEIRLKANYKNKKQNGEWIWYYINGNIHSKGMFIDGCRDGIWFEYDINGEIISETKHLKHD